MTLLHNLQLIHEVITEDAPCSSCAKNQTAVDHSSSTAGNTEPILQRLTNLVDLVKQSKAGCIEGEVHVLHTCMSELHIRQGSSEAKFVNRARKKLA